MAIQSRITPPVPIADRALDTRGRVWHCWHLALDPYASLWGCPATGAGATWAHLAGAYGVTGAWNSLTEVPA